MMERANPSTPKIARREFLSRTGCTTAGLFAASAGPLNAAAFGKRRLKVAAIITEFTYRSHAHVILENFTEPYLFNGKWISPGMDVAGLYVDQFPAGELGREFAQKYNIPIFKSIGEALRLGGSKLTVDAVLSIGEH